MAANGGSGQQRDQASTHAMKSCDGRGHDQHYIGTRKWSCFSFKRLAVYFLFFFIFFVDEFLKLPSTRECRGTRKVLTILSWNRELDRRKTNVVLNPDESQRSIYHQTRTVYFLFFFIWGSLQSLIVRLRHQFFFSRDICLFAHFDLEK